MRGSLLALGLLLVLPRLAAGQAAWEYSPYVVHAWITAAPAVELPPAAIDSIAQTLQQRAEVVFGAVWSLDAGPAPPLLRDDLAAGRLPTAERLQTIAPAVLKADKLLVVSLAPDDFGWRIEVREFDARSRSWSPPISRLAASISELPLAVWDTAAEAFTPVARIETVEGSQITARLRAGGLIVDPNSRALADKGAVLRPIVRRNDRSGEPPKGGIQPVPWTLLSVKQRNDSLLTCEMFSGYRAAIPSRGGVRTERLALVVRPRFPATKLVLQSRAKPPYPLPGYEVHAKSPGEQETRLVGASDWEGAIELPAGDGTLSIFLVKNGNQLLARLPIVPGQSPELFAPLSDDDGRLQAEGAVAALVSRALDLVARREILAARFRARLKEQKYDEAQVLLDQFRNLETRVDLGRALDEQQQQIRGSDKLTQTRIDKLLTDARKLLLIKPLADDLVNTLATELNKAKAAGPTQSGAGL